MTTYRAPLRNVPFLMEEVFNFPVHCAVLGVGDETSAVNAILEEAARFREQELAPFNASGDAEGCHFEAGQVRTPKGFKEAYQKYVARAEQADAAAGAQLTINLTGAMPLNFAAVYSDYHVTGLNPAGNAALTDHAFVASRFRIVQSRRPSAA